MIFKKRKTKKKKKSKKFTPDVMMVKFEENPKAKYLEKLRENEK